MGSGKGGGTPHNGEEGAHGRKHWVGLVTRHREQGKTWVGAFILVSSERIGFSIAWFGTEGLSLVV